MSNLQFYESTVSGPRRLRSFYGSISEQMPLLLSGKDENGNVIDVQRVPMTPKQLLYERVHGENEQDRNLLQNNSVDTACVVMRDRKSREVIVGRYSDPLVARLLCAIDQEWDVEGGKVSADLYQAIKPYAFVISHDEVSNLSRSSYSERRVRKRLWDYVAEGDEQLVRDHLRLVQKKNGGSMRNRMGFWVSLSPGLRLLSVWPVGGDGNLSFSDCLPGLRNHRYLVGVAVPKALNGNNERAAQKSDSHSDPSLEKVLESANE